jgi:hypothetical protein
VRLHLCQQVVARERQIADPLPRCCENRVAERGATERAPFSIHFELYQQFPFPNSGQECGASTWQERSLPLRAQTYSLGGVL